MKTKFLAMVALSSLAFVSCSDDDGDTINNPQNQAEVVNTVSNGTWRITSYIDDDIDQTAYFEGYSFVFGPNNSIQATNDINNYTGFWSVDDDDDDDNSQDDLDFNISFSSNAGFQSLSDDWDIQQMSANRILLVEDDDDNDDDDNDYLVFEKI